MPTLYSSIFTKTNSLFIDAELLSVLTDQEYTGLLEIFLSKAKSIYFKSCKVDLSDVDNVLEQFNTTLSDEEEWILAIGIRLVWLERQLYREEKLRDRITTKDYNASHSTANLIDKLILLKTDAEKSLKEKINSYTFNDFSGFN